MLFLTPNQQCQCTEGNCHFQFSYLFISKNNKWQRKCWEKRKEWKNESYTGYQLQKKWNKHRGIKEFLHMTYGKDITMSSRTQTLRFFSGGSMWDRQWDGLCILSFTLQMNLYAFAILYMVWGIMYFLCPSVCVYVHTCVPWWRHSLSGLPF